MEYTKINIKSFDHVKAEIRKSKSYTCTLPYANRESNLFLSQVLLTILKEVGRTALHEHLEYSLNELVMNASKANTKRLFFQASELDINNPFHYKNGMNRFKEEVFNNFDKYMAVHIEEKTYVKINISVTDNTLQISVENNTPFLGVELLRISEKVQKARKFNNLAEVMAQQFDDSEGGGYGIILIILMLRKMNLTEKALQFHKEGDKSHVSIQIPLNTATPEHSILISDEIAAELRQMPSIPESILELQRELKNPNCTFESIAHTLKGDPSLSAEIIRIANSPIYNLPQKVSNVATAVSLVGMLGVKAILYNYGANKIFEMKYNKKELQELNDHSFYVAQIASFIASYKKLNTLKEDIYTAALLHDMGKIVINSLQQDLTKKLEELCARKHIPIALLDELAEGYNHTVIGSELAKKWEFPEKFCEAIRFHHLPMECNNDFKVMVYSVYLGNEIYYLLREERDFQDINYQVLEFFNLHSENQFFALIDAINAGGIGGL